MFLIYRPEGGTEQRWVFNPGRLRVQEMTAIERRTGLQYGGRFKQELMQGSTLARQALLWTMLRRTHHTLRFEDVDFYDDELLLVQDRDELAAEIEHLEADTTLPEADRLAGLMMLRSQLDEAPYPPGKDPGPAPQVEPMDLPMPEPLLPESGDLPSAGPGTPDVDLPVPAVPGPSTTSGTGSPSATSPTPPTWGDLREPEPWSS